MNDSFLTLTGTIDSIFDIYFGIFFDRYLVNDGFLILTGTIDSIFDNYFDSFFDNYFDSFFDRYLVNDRFSDTYRSN